MWSVIVERAQGLLGRTCEAEGQMHGLFETLLAQTMVKSLWFRF